MEYIASVRLKGTKIHEIIRKEYPTKKAFEQDLRAYGYSVRFVTTEDKFDEACEKWHENNEKVKMVERVRFEYDKSQADRYGISVAHYRRAYKAYSKSLMSDKLTLLSLEDYIKIWK